MPSVIVANVTRKLALIDEVLRLREENEQLRASAELWAHYYAQAYQRAKAVEKDQS